MTEQVEEAVARVGGLDGFLTFCLGFIAGVLIATLLSMAILAWGRV